MYVKYADSVDQAGGWTLAVSYLKDIQERLEHYDDCPSLEQIEMTLLAAKDVSDYIKYHTGEKLT